ncbi:UNVERIFIED_CONTAM: hypothetical protein GTU68_051330, partial [Idotea baltica]|nr:hypothetical protein [Idotea baltica]
FSQIALLAQVCDVFHHNEGTSAAITEIRNRSGAWFDPDIVKAFDEVACEAQFWEALSAPDLKTQILSLEPAGVQQFVDEDYLDEIAEAFAQVVDAKSPFTSGHSERVTVFADLIAAELDYSPDQRRLLRRGALLHDIGKLGVSNSVLDKPGKLNDEEFDAIKMHPVYSRYILAKVSIFQDIAPIAGGHHEKLNGRGYPDGLKGDEINLDTRIVTVADIFDALTADRPYRSSMPESKALEIMDDMARDEIDLGCLDALKSALAKFQKIAA